MVISINFICILYILIIIIFRLKDSDVTWLYGPLHTAVDPVPQPKASTLEDHIDLDKGSGTKPILKHRTISELLTLPSNSSQLVKLYLMITHRMYRQKSLELLHRIVIKLNDQNFIHHILNL